MRPSPTVWTASRSVAIKRWPEEHEVLVFHEVSGSLHSITQTAALVLERLAAADATVTQVSADLPAVDPAADNTIVDALQGLRLIAPARQ